MSTDQGVRFASIEGRRSSQRAGTAILADAVRSVDPDLASAIAKTSEWRKHYMRPFTDTVIAGATSSKNALRIATDGLDSVHEHLTFVRDEQELRLDEAFETFTTPVYDTEVIEGTGRRVTELRVAYKGETLAGDALLRRLDAWVDAQVIEPTARDAVSLVVSNPEWLDLSNHYFAMLGASSEMGPLPALCSWGANVLAVDLPRPRLWTHIREIARSGAGRVHAPIRRGDAGEFAERAGADLLTDGPEVATWLRGFDDDFTIGNYVYADGTNFVRLASGVDALIAALLKDRPDLRVAYLATPTDVFAVSEEIAQRARARAKGSVLGATLRTLSGKKLYANNYEQLVQGEDRRWGISDSLVPIQGPNYALAKSLQRWRAVVSREDGIVSSANVAPASNTMSVTKNKMLAAAYRGAPAFGIEIFDPATTRTLMAALLVHDIRNPASAAHPQTPLDHAFDLFVQGAVHGGIWTLPYEARSVLPIGLIGGFLKR